MKIRWIGMAGMLLLASACNNAKNELVENTSANSHKTPAAAPKQETAATPSAAVAVAADQPTISIATWEETQQLVAQNAGKVIVLDLWASW